MKVSIYQVLDKQPLAAADNVILLTWEICELYKNYPLEHNIICQETNQLYYAILSKQRNNN